MTSEPTPGVPALVAHAVDAAGTLVATTDVYRVDTTHSQSRLYLVPEPDPSWAAIAIAGIGTVAF
jgi:hypothetical protein